MHRAAGNDARGLDVDTPALRCLDRPLAVDRIAEAVDDPAQQTLADRYVDDGTRALDGLAFLDLAVAATTIEYSSAPCSSSTLTNWATVERFWPTAT